MITEQGYVFGVEKLTTPIAGVPFGARLRIRMRPDEWASVVVQHAGKTSVHPLMCTNGQFKVGPEEAYNFNTTAGSQQWVRTR